MYSSINIKKHLSFVCILLYTLLFSTIGVSQEETNSKLFTQLKKVDQLLFEEGFNKCNVETLQSLLHPDLQFIHDQNGIQDCASFLKGFTESICANSSYKPIRKLVEGSLSVYPLYNDGELYGAIQMGLHEFFIKEPGKDLRFTVNGQFIHTWLWEEGQWKLYRALSYDHQQPKKYPAAFEDGSPFPLFDDDSKIEALLTQLKIPSVSIGYIENGTLQQIRAFGQQSPGVPITYNSIYKVASLTKPITALVVLKLIEAGKWSLEEPLASYYIAPALKDSPYLPKLTTQTVLSQQSGLPNWQYLREDKQLVFEFEPGTKFQYSGEGFEYLRKALEAHFNQPLEVLAEEVLFRPLAMRDTYFYWMPEVDERRYAVESDTEGVPLPFTKYTEANAAANLLTTIEDYSKFLEDVLHQAGLSDPLYEAFVTPQSQMKEGIYWGLGMQVFPKLPQEEFALVHTGGDDGTKCIAILLPNSQRGLVIFSNSENGMIVWKKIITEYLGDVGAEIVRRNLE